MSSGNVQSLRSYVFEFVKLHKIYVIALILIAICAGVFEISVDYKIKEIIDVIANDKNADILSLVFFFTLFKLMHHGVYFIRRLLDIRYKPIIVEKTIIDIYNKTVQNSLHWFDSHLSGEIANKISDFQNSITTIISHFFHIFNIVVTIVISLIFLIQINLSAALVLLIFILIYTPVIFCLLKTQMQLQESYVSARQETMGVINDSITNIFAIKVIGNLLTEFKLKLQPSVRKWKEWERKTRQFDAFYVDNADTFMVVTMSAVQIYLLSSLYQQGEITAGGFAFVAMVTLKIHGYLDSFLEILLFNINPDIAQIKSSYALVNVSIDVKDRECALELTQVKGQIEYRDVSFAYGVDGKKVLDQLNLKINCGERVGIVGASGAGKTTILKCLLRYFDVMNGEVLVDGHNIKNVSQASLRQAISIIPQDINMFHRSIKDNLRLAKFDASDEEIITACKKAQIHHDILEMPNGYETIVGERGVKLSGGQRQRVAIARAILKNAPILILDEATSNLDSITENSIQKSIDEILTSSNATIIAIAHRLSTLKHMDRIIMVDQGKIMETGTHASLMKKENGLYKKLWDTQNL